MASKPVPAKKKSTTTTATDGPKEASTKPSNVNKQEEPNSYKIVLTTSTRSLSGSCDLQYQLSLSEYDDLCLRIYSSTGTGLFSRQWISLDEAWKCLTDWDHGPVAAMALFPMFRNQSVNTPAYVTAALLDMSLLTPSKEKARHFDLVDDDRFAAIVADLKAKHKQPSKRKPKAKA